MALQVDHVHIALLPPISPKSVDARFWFPGPCSERRAGGERGLLHRIAGSNLGSGFSINESVTVDKSRAFDPFLTGILSKWRASGIPCFRHSPPSPNNNHNYNHTHPHTHTFAFPKDPLLYCRCWFCAPAPTPQGGRVRCSCGALVRLPAEWGSQNLG